MRASTQKWVTRAVTLSSKANDNSKDGRKAYRARFKRVAKLDLAVTILALMA
jgi:hypothetical protein